jgi:proteasome lid subunit RPN8/RPN11
MSFFTRLSIRAFVAPRSRIRITPRRWDALIEELRVRGNGDRESGAFLLARADGRHARTVDRIVYFDDVDPTCLTGGITIQSSGFAALSNICNAHGLRVIADVHTHPGAWVEQSGIDRANPMIATRGHVAVIVPNFAAAAVRASECGVHVYRGSHTWDAHKGSAARKQLYIGRWA